MADDSRIEIVASLDIPKSVSTIKKDLESVKKQLDADKALSITCSIDENSIRNIQSQLSKMSEQLKINIPKIELNADSGKAGAATEVLSKGLEHASENARTLKRTLADLEDKYTKPFKAVLNTDGLIDAERTLSKIESRLSALGTVTVTGRYGDGNAADSLDRITAEIKASSGEVRTLNFLLDETDDKFKLLNSTFSDKGVGKVQQDIARLSKELANFEASHQAIESGLTQPLTDARNAIIDLQSGVGSVETAQKALDNLKTKAAEIGTSLKSTGSSFNIFDNAANKAKNFDNAIKALQSDINALSNETSKTSLTETLASATKSLAELQQIESASGKNLEWSKKYGEVSKSIQDVTNGLRAAQKAEKSLSQDQAFSNRIKKLTADMNAFAVANRRAIDSTQKMSSGKSFADEWSRLNTEIQKGSNLSNTELKNLQAQFRIFGKEAETAGLKGESAFGKFLKSFKVMSSYITANMVFNMVKRQIRNLVNEVTSLDTAMVELRKVTVATDEDFRKFELSAAATAKELGASITDVVNATSTFARLGESLPDAEELGRVAILYQNVGDGITEAQASEDLVSVMKAFKIEARDAITVVDKLNEVGNNYAITSGGIGEALKRSASALAAANNDISESIALITTANTIAQNPEAVGTGMKTMALRLRSTKTELEEMGEDAEGAAENVSKLREQMLALTGVDIQLDDTTYKSSYQILLEISKVWERLDDLSRASVLEQLFGKRQANIGAAILENGRLLERVYETSENSAGSALREQEEYAKSIQFAIDSLKASYQEFANAIIGSDLVKNILKTAQTFLEVLTSITKTFGALPPLIAAVSTAMGIKGRGIFQAEGIQSFAQAMSSLKNNLRTIASYGTIKDLYSQYNINLNGISKDDVASLQKYVNLLNSGTDAGAAFDATMINTSQDAKALTTGFNSLNLAYKSGTITEKEYIAATQSLSAAQTTAAATSKALTIALNAVGNIAIMAAITAIVKGISYVADKLIVTKEELAEIREEALQDVETLSNNVSDLIKKEEDIQDLINSYKEIVNSTKDMSESKDDLLKIQDSLINKFGDEKHSLDLLNDSYDQTIAKIKELSDAEYEEWKIANADKIAKAEKMASYNVSYLEANQNDGLFGTPSIDYEEYNDVLMVGADNLADSLYVIKDVAEEIEDVYEEIEGIDFADNLFHNTLFLSGSISDAEEQLGQLILSLREAGASEETLKPLVERYNDLKQAVEDVNKYIEQNNLREAEYVESLNDVSTKSLNILQQTESAAEELRSSWFKNLKEVQDGAEKTVNNITAALQTISNGEALTSTDFWNLMELDTNKVLSDISMVGDKFVVNQEQLIRLKDEYIQKQISSLEKENETLRTKKEELKITLDEARAEMAMLGARGLSNSAYVEQFKQANESLANAEKNLQTYGRQIDSNNIRIEEWKRKLGDVANTQEVITKQIENLNKAADNLLKAQEYKIDQIVDTHESEKEALENEKALLEEELQVLEDQETELENIVSNYESVNKLVQDTVQREIDALEEQKKAIEDTYGKRIDALKAENEERSDALEYAQKLANLENAKNNKRRVYDEARGWRYEAVKEDVVKAENDLAEFENSQAIKQLEKERDKEVAAIDDIIDKKKEYSAEWAEILDSIQSEEDELLAAEILGADWREKIASGDIDTLNKFRNEYRNHNTALQQLTKTEIKLKEEAIKAKDAEIKSKQEQIDAWKKYKKEVQDTANTIKNANKEYMDSLDKVALKESDGFDERENNLRAFANEYGSMMSQINYWQEQLDNGAGDYDFNLHVNGLWELEEAVRYVKELGIEYNAAAIGKYLFDNSKDMDKDDARKMLMAYADASTNMRGYSSGGVADYTGVAMLHGRKNAPETIFNAADSAKLYDLVHNTPNLMADVINQATKLTGFNLTNSNANSNTANTITVSIGSIYANNPSELTTNLDRHLDQYFTKKLTQSYTGKQ